MSAMVKAELIAKLDLAQSPLEPLQDIPRVELGWGSEEHCLLAAIPAYGWVLEPDDL